MARLAGLEEPTGLDAGPADEPAVPTEPGFEQAAVPEVQVLECASASAVPLVLLTSLQLVPGFPFVVESRMIHPGNHWLGAGSLQIVAASPACCP